MNNMCQHDINCKDNTMRIYNRRFMVAPDHICAICKNCGLSIVYIKNKKGDYIAKEDGNETE